MSISCSDCSTDLLCGEQSEILSSDESPRYSSEIESPRFIDESIAIFTEHEMHFVPGFDSQSLDASARKGSIAWILKVQAYYGFQPLTAYLSVNYLDRFLYSAGFPKTNGWPLQLLSVACLSLAVKMEEPLVPSMMDLQVEDAKYIFEPRTIRRMEFVVLGVLDWRLRSITPFTFISYFACKLDAAGAFTGFLISRATDIILSNISVASIVEYKPSCIAAAAIITAANELPHLCVNPEDAESWCDGLSKDKIRSCYRLIQDLVVENYQENAPKVIQQVRVTVRARVRSGELSSSSSCYKRRKLNNWLWIDNDKGKSK